MSEGPQNTDELQVLDVNLPTQAKEILGKGGSIADLPQPAASVRFTDELEQARKIYARLHNQAAQTFQAIADDKTPVIPPLLEPVREVAQSINATPVLLNG